MKRLPAPDAAAARKSYLRRLSDMLDEHPFLLGAAPCVADFAAYAPIWFGRITEPGSEDMLQPVPALIEWMDRMQAIGHGESLAFESAQAIQVAADAEPLPVGHGHLIDSTFQDEHGIALGSRVTVRAESFGPEATEGTLIAATRTHYSLERTDARAGTVHVHFPRIGYVLERAAP